MQNKSRITVRIILILYLLGLCFCCFWDFRGSVDMSRDLFGLPADKVTHFLMFFPFPVITYLSFPKFSDTPLGFLRFSIITLIVGIVTGAATELVQGWSGYRSCDKMDLLADCCGLASSTLMVQFHEAFIRKRRKTSR